ncbi:MAG: hypothetical protein SH820_14185 [Xanthomonadales bacterium]|nr:hypothetical protein [Xanthomonadales bacterium]
MATTARIAENPMIECGIHESGRELLKAQAEEDHSYFNVSLHGYTDRGFTIRRPLKDNGPNVQETSAHGRQSTLNGKPGLMP